MDSVFLRIGKFIVKVFITELILVAFAFMLSYFSKMTISTTLTYTGAFCLILGVLSFIGNKNNSSNANSLLSSLLRKNSAEKITEENNINNNSNSSKSLLIYLFCVGVVLLLVGFALTDFVLTI